jgi:nucleotide-binding universal stress UspA family protein
MYRHILIPTDGSRLSKKAIVQGVALARARPSR